MPAEESTKDLISRIIQESKITESTGEMQRRTLSKSGTFYSEPEPAAPSRSAASSSQYKPSTSINTTGDDDDGFAERQARLHGQIKRKRDLELASLRSYISDRVGSADPEDLERFRQKLLSGDPAALETATTLGIVPISYYNPACPEPPTVRVHYLDNPLQVQARNRLLDIFADERTRLDYQSRLLTPEEEFEITRDMVTVATAACPQGIIRRPGWVDERLQDCIRFVDELTQELIERPDTDISKFVSHRPPGGGGVRAQTLELVFHNLRDRVENSVFPDIVGDDTAEA